MTTTVYSISESEGGSSSQETLAQEEEREEDEDEEDNEYEPPHKVTKLSQTETTDEDKYWIFLDYYDIPIHISKTIDSASRFRVIRFSAIRFEIRESVIDGKSEPET